MKVGLIDPPDDGVLGNPGRHLLTAGIRWLVRQAVPGASFIPINQHAPDRSWDAAPLCDALIFCGNPRFTMSTGDAFWENAIWDKLAAMPKHIRIIDGWAGSAFPYNEYHPTAQEMAVAIAAFPGRAQYLQIAKTLHGRITRDATMQAIYENAGATSVLLPCSSWWARDEYNVHSEERRYDVLVLYRMPGHEWLPLVLQDRVSAGLSERPLRVIATTLQDYEWGCSIGLDKTELVADPASILRLYAAAEHVLSFRLHAAIPAASMGCKVTALSIDSRTDACVPFAIPVVRLTELGAWTPAFNPTTVPDTNHAVNTLRSMLL